MTRFLISILFSLAMFITTLAQDTIVRTNGDTLHCKIINVDSTKISFSIKLKHKKTDTYLNRDQIKEYTINSVEKKKKNNLNYAKTDNNTYIPQKERFKFAKFITTLAQDTIVRTNGDTLHCKITNVDSTKISFSIKLKHKKVDTYINRDQVKEYKINSVEKMKLNCINLAKADDSIYIPLKINYFKGISMIVIGSMMIPGALLFGVAYTVSLPPILEAFCVLGGPHLTFAGSILLLPAGVRELKKNKHKQVKTKN